jgi:MoaA/NifB/PqqE/SkfB family radical SAM enzyme
MERTNNHRLHPPGFWESLKELLPGHRRMLDCVQVEVTTRCPGRCNYCPHTLFAAGWRNRDISMESFERLWPLMRRSARVHLQGWGEPLLHPQFFDMAALARRAGCAVSTTTSGLTLDEVQSEALVDSGLDIVAFSLTGTDAESNAARLGIPFERVCAAIERLQSVRRAKGGVHLEIHIAYLLLASNMAAVRGLPELMQRLGVHAAVVSTLDYLPDPDLAGEAFLPEDIKKLSQAEAVLTETAARARHMGLAFDFHLPGAPSLRPTCRENIGRSLAVSADGAVSPCVYRNIPAADADPRRLTFGNVSAVDPLSIWESDVYRAFRTETVISHPDSVCVCCPKLR